MTDTLADGVLMYLPEVLRKKVRAYAEKNHLPLARAIAELAAIGLATSGYDR